MELVFTLSLTLLFPLMLVAKPGTELIVLNAPTIGILILYIFVLLFLIFVKHHLVLLVRAVSMVMFYLMDHAFTPPSTALSLPMLVANNGIGTNKFVIPAVNIGFSSMEDAYLFHLYAKLTMKSAEVAYHASKAMIWLTQVVFCLKLISYLQI